MTPGPNELVKCPACGDYQQRRTLRSGNTVGATFYSDGKRVAPMLPEFPYFIKCPKCGKFFTISREVISNDKLADGERSPFVRFLTIDEYKQAIEEGLVNGKDSDILLLRTFLWRAYNDIIRQGGEIEEKERVFYEENCRTIIAEKEDELKDGAPELDGDRLMCAELWRNIGEFDKSKAMLNAISRQNDYKRYIDAIRTACDAKNPLTVRITFD